MVKEMQQPRSSARRINNAYLMATIMSSDHTTADVAAMTASAEMGWLPAAALAASRNA
jgi:hypothetical protein